MHKILLLLTASLIQTAVAADLPKEMYMPNDAGGFFVLTTRPCTIEKMAEEYPYRAYATESSDLVYHEGCWNSPDTSEVLTQLMSKSEGAGLAPTIHVIPLVNTWWVEAGRATFMQRNFRPEKKRHPSNGAIETTLPPIVVKP
jgi:hypothetical protein